MVRLLFPHTAYKSYPENWLVEERWERLDKWLDTVSTHRVVSQDRSDIQGVDDWVEKLEKKGHYLSCSSGTTGKSAMLVASKKDMDWCQVEAIAAYTWGSGVEARQDRRMFGLAAVAHTARAIYTGKAYEALQNSRFRAVHSPYSTAHGGRAHQHGGVAQKDRRRHRPAPAISSAWREPPRHDKKSWMNPSASRRTQ